MANEVEIEYWRRHRYGRSDIHLAYNESVKALYLLLLHIDEKGELQLFSRAQLPVLHVEQTANFFKSLYAPGEFANRSFLVSCADAYSGSPRSTALGRVPVFAISKLRADCTVPLIPDPEYLVNRGYEDAWRVASSFKALGDKTPVLYWRGRTTGSEMTAENWKANPRVRLALKAKETADSSLLDAYLVEIVQCADESVKKALHEEGLLRPFADPSDFLNYRFLLDIDGNASAWSCFPKLGYNALLFKVEGGCKQWFSDYLKPWVHYVPVSSDLSDLVESIRWAKDNPAQAAAIAAQCNELAGQLNYAAVIEDMKKLFREILSFADA